jgi:hypothetical protein
VPGQPGLQFVLVTRQPAGPAPHVRSRKKPVLVGDLTTAHRRGSMRQPRRPNGPQPPATRSPPRATAGKPSISSPGPAPSHGRSKLAAISNIKRTEPARRREGPEMPACLA